MSESIYHDQDGGTPPAGSPPSNLDEDIARAEETLEEEKGLDADQAYGRVEHDFSGPSGNPGRSDQGRSTGRTQDPK
jgi:hypothetical protein